MAISTEYGISDYYFGGKDYEAARAQGKSPSEVLSYLIANPDRLRLQNVPGGGGIYDKIVKEAAAYQQQQMAPKVNFEEILQQQRKEAEEFQRKTAEETARLQREFQDRITQQQSLFQQQLVSQQQQAQESQRQLMIQLQRPDRAPAEVRMAGGDQQYRRRGPTSYFGREGLRISGLNVPTVGLSITPNTATNSKTGSFV